MQPPLLSPSLSNLCVKGVASSPHNIPKETKSDGLDRAGFGVGETRKHKRVVLCSSTPPNFIPHYKHDFTKNLISRHIFGRLSLDPPFLATCWRGAGAASKPIA